MRKLKPIKSIEIDFGEPTDFSPPSMNDFIASIIAEAHKAEESDERFDIHELDYELWEKSLTKEEHEEYDRLVAAEKAAMDNYDPTRDDEQSEAAQAYFKASNLKNRFSDTHGQHICFHCSYYTMPLKEKEAAGCFKHKKIVRPTCLACECFTTDYTPEDKARDEQERIFMAQHPRYAEQVRLEEERDRAERVARRLMEGSEIVDFTSYERYPESYQIKYRKFPEIFASTPYPTFEDFKAAQAKFMEKYDHSKKDTGR